MHNILCPKIQLTVRKQIKEGWILVEIARQNLYNWPNENWGDQVHFRKVFDWCCSTFPAGEWTASSAAKHLQSPYFDDVVCNRFVFKHHSHAILFRLKWSEVVR